MIFTIALIQNYRLLDKVAVSIRKELRKKYKRANELHANKADYITRKRMFHHLAQVPGLEVMCVALNKAKVHIDFENQKQYLYVHAVNILLDALLNKKHIAKHEPISLYIDRKDTNKNLRDQFMVHIKKSFAKLPRKQKVDIRLEASHDMKALQAVDFLSWAIFRKYETGDFEFYEVIKNLIINEHVIFP